MGSCGQAGEVVEAAVEVGILRHHPGGGFSNAGADIRRRDNVDGDALGLAVGGDHLAVGRRDGVADDHLLSSGDATGHQHRLGEAGGAVVHSGVGDFHAVEGADHRLELEDDLQGALGHLRLVGRVGGQKLPTGHDRLHDGRDEVVVAAGPQERRAAGQGPIAAGHRAQFPLDLQLRHGVGEPQGRVPVIVRYVGEQVVNAAQAHRGQEVVLLGDGVGDVVGLEVGYHSGIAPVMKG